MLHKSYSKMTASGPLQRSFIIFEILICTAGCIALSVLLSVTHI